MIHHFRKRYNGTLILVGIDWKHGAELLREGCEDLIAFGRDYIANPDLVERIRSGRCAERTASGGLLRVLGGGPHGLPFFLKLETVGTASDKSIK